MKIYTKKGDDGFTDGPDGKRVRKDDAYCSAVGDIDELGAHVGWCMESAGGNDDIRDELETACEKLFAIGSILVGAKAAPSLDAKAVAGMEKKIDEINAELGELKHFLLPGGCELACRLAITRAVARRAERSVSAVIEAGYSRLGGALAYLNRLGDLLFVLSRLANARAGRDERTWTP